MTIRGAPAVLVLVPLLVGVVVCGVTGLGLALMLVDWAVERLLRSLGIYREFLAFARPRVVARMRRRKEARP